MKISSLKLSFFHIPPFKLLSDDNAACGRRDKSRACKYKHCRAAAARFGEEEALFVGQLQLRDEGVIVGRRDVGNADTRINSFQLFFAC